MTTGFFGKIPATGDFVSRNLAVEFVRTWDMWVAQHLMPFVSSGEWAEGVALFFIAGPDFVGPMAGVIVPSRDKVGRQFPLTIAAPVERADRALKSSNDDWLLDIASSAFAARDNHATVDELTQHLSKLSGPIAIPISASDDVRGLVFWHYTGDIVEVPPDAPGPALASIVGMPVAASPGA